MGVESGVHPWAEPDDLPAVTFCRVTEESACMLLYLRCPLPCGFGADVLPSMSTQVPLQGAQCMDDNSYCAPGAHTSSFRAAIILVFMGILLLIIAEL